MGGGSSHETKYEKQRVAVDRRAYGKLSKTGFQSQEQYDKVMAGDMTGLNYDKQYDRYSLASGVDLEAAKSDWGNYSTELQDINTENLKEERRKSAPKNLTGTSGKVDYSLAIDSKGKKKKSNLSTTVKATDTSKSTASTNQSLGIY